MKDYKLNNIFDLEKEDIIVLQTDLQNGKIIPDSNKKLKEKMNFIISDSAMINDILSVFDDNVFFGDLSFEDINPTDFNLLKNHLLKYSDSRETKYFIENKTIKKEVKLTLEHVFNEFWKHKQDIEDEEMELVSLELYDYLDSEKDKDVSLNFMKELMEFKQIKNIKIVSNINTLETYKFYKKLLLKDSDKTQIKYIYKINNQYSYISSLFYMILRFKIGTNYKSYLMYLEPDVNWGYSAYASKGSFSKHFLELLKDRLEQNFNDKYTIDFNKDILNDIKFEDYLDEIIKDIDKLLNSNSVINEDDIFKKIAYLKLHYPKIDLAYKLIKNVVKNIMLAQEIKNEKLLKDIPHTEHVIKKMQKEHILHKINKIYNDIPKKEISIDIFKLRKSIFVNIFGEHNQSICDVFHNLEWSDLDKILNSLDKIYYEEVLLDRFFNYINHKYESFQEKQTAFDKILQRNIMKGTKIPIKLKEK